MTNKINIMIKYFYSWYTYPLCILHEGLHYLMCLLTNTKVNSFKIYRDNIGLYNGSIKHDVPDEKWKVYLIVFAPMLLVMLPLILSFFSTIAWYLLLYVITTAIFYKKDLIWMVLPSITDITYIEYWEYSRKHLLMFVKKKEILKCIKDGTYNKLLDKFNILTHSEFMIKRNI